MSKSSILSLFGLLLLLSFLFPLEATVSKLLTIKISKRQLLFGLTILVLGVLAVFYRLQFLFAFPLLTFSFCVFLFGFHVDRKYIYTLALVFLISCPLLLLMNLNEIAEYNATLCYLLLVLGVLKDLVYSRIYE